MIEPFYHFITFQHGYYGGARDLSYFVKLFRDHSSLPKTFVILTPKVNERFHTDQGVLRCAERLVDYLINQVEETLANSKGQEPKAEGSSTKDAVDGSENGWPDNQARRNGVDKHLYFSFVAHSMGGLIVRAALPLLAAALEQKYGCTFASRHSETGSSSEDSSCRGRKMVAHWETFCSVAVPHVGVAQMPSRLKAWFAKRLASLSTGLRDMCLISDTLTDTLLRDTYLDAWRSFKRRILATALNDQTVMTYSSIFCFLSKDHNLLCMSSGSKTKHERAERISEMKSDQAPSQAGSFPLATGPEKTNAGTIVHSNLTELTPEIWPVNKLPRERAMAERIVKHVGPFEVCLLDLTLQLPQKFSVGAFWDHVGVQRFGHGAVICRYPWNNSKVFGVLCEYIVNDVLSKTVTETQGSVVSHPAEQVTSVRRPGGSKLDAHASVGGMECYQYT